MKRIAGALVLIIVVAPVLFVLDQAMRTLGVLAAVERERDTWQRPDDVIERLELGPGQTVVDLGSGAGYFALKIAPRVGSAGRVLAVDLRRQSLAFLWIRAVRDRLWNLDVVHGEPDDPHLPAGGIDRVLIANTYHELSAPAAILNILFASMRSGGRLVVLDRSSRAPGSALLPAVDHEVTAADAEREFTSHGFQAVVKDDRFIDRPQDDDLWWLIVFRRP